MKRILGTLFIAISSFSFAQINLSSGLIACYALNGNGAEPVNNLTGTLSSVTSTLGHYGVANTACHFNGDTSSYIKLPASSIFKPNEISFSAWVKADTLEAGMMIMFARNTSTTTNYTAYYAVAIDYYNGAYRFGVLRQTDNTNTGYYPHSTTTLTINKWYHIAFAMNTATMQVYVNGLYESFLYTLQNFTYNPVKNVILGSTNESPSSSFKGSLDNVLFYNRVLSAGEINALYYQDPACGLLATGFQERMPELEVEVYPNPTAGKFVIDISDAYAYNFILINILGEIILEGKVNFKEKKSLDLNDRPNGIYFLKIKSGEALKTVKIIKE